MTERAATAAKELDQWASENSDLLNLVWEWFDREGEWPEAAELTRRHFMTRPRRDYTAIAQAMPPALGRLDVVNGNRVLLNVRALSYIRAAGPLRSAFFRLVRLAIRRYEDVAGKQIVGAAEFPGLLQLDEKTARQLEEVALLDNWLLRAAGGMPGSGDLQFSVDERTVFWVADVESLDEYLQSQLLAWYPELERTPAAPATRPPTAAPLERDPARVMVVHGRDVAARNDLFALLRALGLRPIEWNEAVGATETATPYTGDAVEAAFRIAQAAVVLCTPDEQVLLREQLRDPNEPGDAETAWQPRPNVRLLRRRHCLHDPPGSHDRRRAGQDPSGN